MSYASIIVCQLWHDNFLLRLCPFRDISDPAKRNTRLVILLVIRRKTYNILVLAKKISYAVLLITKSTTNRVSVGGVTFSSIPRLTCVESIGRLVHLGMKASISLGTIDLDPKFSPEGCWPYILPTTRSSPHLHLARREVALSDTIRIPTD